MEFQLADLFECLCDARPDAPALVAGKHRSSRRELDERANQVAHALHARGVRRGDRVGVYAANRSEWVEILLACWKLGAATVNVNFRYVTEELRHVWKTADMTALVYERGHAARVAELAPEFPRLRRYWVLDDRGLDEESLEASAGEPGPGEPFEAAVASQPRQRGFDARSGDDPYLVFTGGTTGLPKGVLWRHEDLYRNIAQRLAGPMETPAEVVRQADNPLRLRTLTLAPLMHGGGQWPLLITVLNGGVALFPASRRLDSAEVLTLIERERVSTLSLIGDAMARPIAEAQLAGPRDTSSLKAVSSGGALLTAPVRELLRRAFGRVLITGGIGSSEIGSAARETGAMDPDAGPRFALDETVAVLDDTLHRVGPGGVGRLARSGHIPLGYFGDPDKTAATFPTDANGTRWVVPGDYARVEDDGTILLLGRGSQCINSGGEKIFPDEVEQAIARHPAVRHAAVVGVPDPRWQERVFALVELQDPDATLSLETLQEHCRTSLAGYKIPRGLALCTIQRTPAGKLDMVWARAFAARAAGGRKEKSCGA